MEKIRLKVTGMVCEGCEERIKNALKRIEGVMDVQADHQTGLVTITGAIKEKEASLKEKLIDLGFEVGKDA